MWRACLFALFFTLSASASEEKAALADLVRVPHGDQYYTRYFEVPLSILDEELEEFSRLFAYHLNSLSRKQAIVMWARVTPRVWRIDIRDPKWNRDVYEKLGPLDFYHHQKAVLIETEEIEEYGNWYLDGKAIPAKVPGAVWITDPKLTVRKKVKKPANEGKQVTGSAPWLDPPTMAKLVELTQSETPLLRADWFWVQTVRHLDRENVETGAGYYDFLELKSLGDVEALAGLDPKLARKLERQIAAVVKDSGVAINNRGIFREGAASGGFWRTLDVAGQKGKRNALRLLNGDFVSEAQEIYAFLPNNLFFYAAVNTADGTLQPFVPTKFAGDKETTNNLFEIHPAHSCQRCHLEGLRPIRDWSRQFYADGVHLTAADRDVQKRLEGLYLTPLEEWRIADNLIYSQALFRVAGWKPAEAAAAYKKWWKRLAEDEVPAATFALELHTTERHFIASLIWVQFITGRIDPVIAGYLKQPPINPSRSQVEELFGLAAGYVRGYLP